jgi:hypothetical protein
MGYEQPKPKKVRLTDARTGHPNQREAKPAGTVTEAINRRTIRQAILTQLLTEVADEIIKSEATVTVYNDDGSVKKEGNLKSRYEKEKGTTFRMLRDLIADPEVAFNTRRNKLSIVDKPEDPSITQPLARSTWSSFGVRWPSATAIRPSTSKRSRSAWSYGLAGPAATREHASGGHGEGSSGGYGEGSSGGYGDRGFAGCK